MATNVLIIRTDVTFISFEASDFLSAAHEVAKLYDDPIYRLKKTDPVFISINGQGRSEYTVGELIREIDPN